MKVKMLRTESGRYAGFGDTGQYHCLLGHEYEVPDALAKAWVDAGLAKKVRATKEDAPAEATAETEAKGATKKGVKNGD